MFIIQMIWKLKISSAKVVVGLIISILLLVISSCTTVKPYQRAYLEDRDMKFQQNSLEKFEQSAHTYREGAAGGSLGKSSGGCGCN